MRPSIRALVGMAASGHAIVGLTILGLAMPAAASGLPAPASPSSAAPWSDPARPPAERAAAAVAAMTLDEKLALVLTHVGTPDGGHPKPPGAIGSAAVWPGVPRLGIPAQQEADGSLGVANPLLLPELEDVVALPSSLATAASFDPALARAAGAMIGGEARAKGFGILLAGGAALAREPRGGRTFEYSGEDPLLAGRMVGATIAGVQSAGVLSTLKHFAFDDQENGRMVLDARAGEAAARESDLLAFEIALEDGRPGAVMAGYSRVDGAFASQDAALLGIVKDDWRFPGFVMSDWGATHSTAPAVLAGLDQQSGEEFDGVPFFGEPLRQAVGCGTVPAARLDDMARRILVSNFGAGIVDRPAQPGGTFDREADVAAARRIEASGIVLLRNERLADGNAALPLRQDLHQDLRRIVVVGAHADLGVLSGGGSSQVLPHGSRAFPREQPLHTTIGLKYYQPGAPLDAIRARAPGTQVDFISGDDQTKAAEAARGADRAIVFAEQWMAESRDAPDLHLPGGQDALIAAVAAANPRTIVVLETGSAVAMPWLAAVPGVVEAWYPGSGGAEAIADVLFGEAEPSGRLPLTFPADESQLPRPALPSANDRTSNPQGRGTDVAKDGFTIDYDIEGADVGYRWFASRQLRPLFPFGYGLSYTRFRYAAPQVWVDGTRVEASIEVRNEGERAGTAVPQFYVERDGVLTRRLVGWGRATLRPGEARRVTASIDPRLLARFDVGRHGWRIAAGDYTLSVRADAAAAGEVAGFSLPEARLAP